LNPHFIGKTIEAAIGKANTHPSGLFFFIVEEKFGWWIIKIDTLNNIREDYLIMYIHEVEN